MSTATFDDDLIQRLAAELERSDASRVQIEQFSRRFPGMRVEDGYAVARAWMAMKFAQGRKRIGRKIGLTSRAMQQSSQIDEPDFGTLLDDMLYAPGEIPAGRFIVPKVEVELAFVLKRGLRGEGLTIDDVLDATDYITPAIEIIDARIEQVDRETKKMRRVQDTISDNAASAGVILGGTRSQPRALDLPWCGAVLRLNGVVEETGLAAGVQGHPAIGVAWLAGKMAPWGEGLEAGEIVLAGSFTRPVPAKAGDVFDADYGPLGRFQFKFI